MAGQQVGLTAGALREVAQQGMRTVILSDHGDLEPWRRGTGRLDGDIDPLPGRQPEEPPRCVGAAHLEQMDGRGQLAV